VDEVCDELAVLEQYNDKTIKPAAIKIVFDKDITTNSTEVISESTDDSNISTFEEEKQGTSEAVINTVQSVYPSEKWKPGLNNIIEETSFQIQHIAEDGSKQLYPVTSAKRQRSMDTKVTKCENRIATAIKKGGLYRVNILSAQHDGGANRSVTSSKDLLLHYEQIADYAINGVKDGEPAITCIGKGYIPWRSNSGEIILVRCFYCPEVSGTILSPSDINAQYSDRYTGWVMDTDFDSKTGNFRLIARDGIHHLTFSAYSENQLWFHYLDQVTNAEYEKIGTDTRAIVRNLTGSASYELWHHRLGHPGDTVMTNVHKHVIGVPKLRRPKFYSCASCMSAKMRKAHIGKQRKYVKVPTDVEKCEPGQHLHLDFGFVRGSDWSMKDNDGKLVTSVDGYRSYCLIIDRASRYIWIILTKRKTPPVTEVRHLLTQLQAKVQSTYRTVTTDLGGELARSKEFQKMLVEPNVNYQLRTTGAHSSAQNGLAEKPNQDLARMMRAMLYGAGLGSEFWTYAIRHAVYLKNRLPHVSLNMTTPYEALNKTKPDLSRLRVFGSRVHFMHNQRAKKARQDG
jgi:hypothetical protein